MSDRKYRQRGYQDDDQSKRHPRDEQRQGASKDRPPREFRKANLPGFREVSRCKRCGQLIDSAVDNTQPCTKCGSSLHSCGQCTWFDTGARFECGQPIAERITPKDGQMIALISSYNAQWSGRPAQSDHRMPRLTLTICFSS